MGRVLYLINEITFKKEFESITELEGDKTGGPDPGKGGEGGTGVQLKI
jgi:hypothetical protein